jgi:hypothetical protein
VKTVYRYTIDIPKTPDRLDREISIAQLVTRLKGTIVSVEQITPPPEVGDVISGQEAMTLPEGTVVITTTASRRPRIVNGDGKLVGADHRPYVPPYQGSYKIIYIPPKV